MTEPLGEIEAFEHRLKRFLDNVPLEIPLNIIHSIENFDLREVREACKHRLYGLMFLGVHAIIQTVCESVFGKRGRAATRFYLENFVDGSEPHLRFSVISDHLHEARNVRAHRWSSQLMHDYGFSDAMDRGWEKQGRLVRINPRIFLAEFLRGYVRLWDNWKNLVAPDELLLRNYEYLKRWLGLASDDPISVQIGVLRSCTSCEDRQHHEELIRRMIRERYHLS